VLVLDQGSSRVVQFGRGPQLKHIDSGVTKLPDLQKNDGSSSRR
jgi:hypothetical protein